MTWETIQLLSLVNLAFCVGIVWSCICRLNSELCRVYKSSRAIYSLLLTGAMACGLQPIFFGYAPGEGVVLFSGSVFVSLVLNLKNWNRFLDHVHKRKGD